MANDPAPVNGLDVINTVYGSGFDINTEGLEDRINAVTDKIEKEYTEGKNIGKKPRILVTGSPSGGAAFESHYVQLRIMAELSHVLKTVLE